MSDVVHTERAPPRAYPAHLTFDDLVAANKRKSALLMVVMVLLLVAVGAAIAALVAQGGDPRPTLLLGAGASFVVALGACAWSFYGGDKTILGLVDARELEKADDPQLFNVVEELSIAAGLPMPRVHLIDDDALNAFATGRDPEHASVAITRGLRERLSRDELAGVMAHELSHVRHYDVRFAMLMVTLVGLVVIASDATWRVLRLGALRSRSSRSSRGGGSAVQLVVLAVALVLLVVAPLLAAVIRFAMSREREYLADAGAVELTRYPQGLIGALEKLGADHRPLAGAHQATSHLFIVNPLKSAARAEGHSRSSAFATHPSLQDRIARLQALT